MSARGSASLIVAAVGLSVLSPQAGAGTGVALVGGTVHPVSGPPIERATLVMEGERIVAVGVGLDLATGTRIIDVSGLHVYPALFSADTVLGLVEISSVRGTIDVNEVGDINSNVRAEVAINPDSELIAVTRSNGVLVALSAPKGGLIAGTSAVIRLDGWTWDDMTVSAPAALHVNWPELTIDRGAEAKKKPEEQRKALKAKVKALSDAFAEARAYHKARAAARGAAAPAPDPRWEALAPVLDGRIPVVVHAQSAQQIAAALAWSKAEGVRLVIAGGRDAWRLTEALKAQAVPVVVDPVLGLPARDYEAYDAVYSLPAKLHAAGVPFAIAFGDSAFSAAIARTLPYHAAMASAFGLDAAEALRSITLSPAEIFGVADRLGSLEPGKEATLFVADGDPLAIESTVLRAFVAGREIDLDDRHKRLWRKYDGRPHPR